MAIHRPSGVIVDRLERRQLFATVLPPFVKTFGGAGFDQVSAVAVDPTGAVVVAGLFSGTTDFFPQAAGGTLTARGDTDAFVAKYSAIGELVWVRQIGGDSTDKRLRDFTKRDLLIDPKRLNNFVGSISQQPGGAGEYVTSVAVDSRGDVVLTGAFRGQISVAGVPVNADESIDRDFYDAMVVKFDSGGGLRWVRKVTGPFDNVAMSAAIDRSNNVYVGGYYTRQADFDPTSGSSRRVTPGRDAGYVARFSDTGDLSWVYEFSSDSIDENSRNAVNDLAVTATGNVYFVGTFGGRARFAANRSTIDSAGETDAVLGSLNRKGQLNWLAITGGDSYDGNTTIALSDDGSIYTGGYFSGEVDVNPQSGVKRVYTATPEPGRSTPRYTDILVSRFTPTGVPVWQSQFGGGFDETITDLQLGEDGSVYAVGSFFDTVDFAPGPGVATLDSYNTNGESIRDSNIRFKRTDTFDWYVNRLSPRGKYVSAAQFGGRDDDFASSLAVGRNGHLYLGGRATTARGNRDIRQEQSLVLDLDVDLTRFDRRQDRTVPT